MKEFHFAGSQKVRRASSPVNLLYRNIASENFSIKGQFFAEGFEVGGENIAVFRNDLIAGAEVAEAFTEGQMEIKRVGFLP